MLDSRYYLNILSYGGNILETAALCRDETCPPGVCKEGVCKDGVWDVVAAAATEPIVDVESCDIVLCSPPLGPWACCARLNG